MKVIGLVLILLGWQLQAQEAMEPVVLSISGPIIEHGQHLDRVDYTLRQLQAFPQDNITTSHVWTRQPHTYTGPALQQLLAPLFAHTTIKTLTLGGLNGYSIAVDWSKVVPYDPILAWQDNGQAMSRRNKGPLWLMLPFDQVPVLQQAEFTHLMVWQLRHIKVQTEIN
ncbi:molybdopterin-binding protein [Zobellella maritima]|uniref:molybdopterin-binding protein n=1 Tax=Zobellella maritima TaxID=2059725 RepID=UPI000E308338|nr:molybdopterin-binding protein [Zobellella maritima]